MKSWIIRCLLLATCWGAWGDPLSLINTLPTRPVLMFEISGLTQTRTVAPGNRISLEAGLFSGLGQKKVPLTGGTIYYLARFGALEGLYRLAADQVLILNQSGRPVVVVLDGNAQAEGNLATGALALGALGEEGLSVRWEGSPGQELSQQVSGGKVYRLVLDSPEGIGTVVSLIPWD